MRSTKRSISWAYFGGSYNDAVALSNDAVTAGTAATLNSSTALGEAALADPAHALGIAYCQICNPFQYATSIMGNPAQRAAHIKDTVDLLADIQADTLPRFPSESRMDCSMATRRPRRSICLRPMCSRCSTHSRRIRG